MIRKITATALLITVLWGGFFVGATRHLAENVWPEW